MTPPMIFDRYNHYNYRQYKRHLPACTHMHMLVHAFFASSSLEMAWDVLSGAAKMAWDVLSGVAKIAWDVLSGVTNRRGMFCPECQKMAWDVLSRYVLSYIP